MAFEGEWSIDLLPWNLLPMTAGSSRHQADKELDMPLLAAIENLVAPQGSGRTGVNAALAYLYLYMIMAGSIDTA